MPWEALGVQADLGRESGDDAPVKPGIPLLLPCALALWATTALAYACARDAPSIALAVGAALGGAGTLAIAVALLCGWRRPGLSLAAGCLLGAALACMGALCAQADARWSVFEQREYAFELLEDASRGDYGLSAKARATDGQGRSVTVRLEWGEGQPGLCGQRFSGTCLLAEPAAQAAGWYWVQGVAARARPDALEPIADGGPLAALRSLRAQAVSLLCEHGQGQGPLLAALACGFREPLKETGEYDRYKAVGLAHVVAVSGAHLAIVVAVASWALRRARAPKAVSTVALLGLVGAYLVLAGIPLSAVRAAIMVALALAGQGLARRSASLSALALCIVGFIALSPSAALSVSLFLSAGSTLGIVLFAGLFSSWLRGLPRAGRRLVAEPLGLTCAANLATQPAAAALFSQLPLIAPLSNLLATPLFSLGCVVGLASALLACAFPSAAPALIGAAAVAAWPLQAVSDALASVPFASIPVSLPFAPMVAASIAAALALWAAWPQPSLRALGGVLAAGAVALACAIAVLPSLDGDRIIMLDVGQGDAFLVRSGGSAVLIDTGNQDSLLREALGREGAWALDAVLVTHPDGDHCASLASLQGIVAVRGVYAPADALECACERCEGLRQDAGLVADGGLQGLEAGDELRVGSFTLRVIWPDGYADEGGNGDSLCLLASLDADHDGQDDWTALFCGDAEAEQLSQMVAEGRLGPIDVLKVPHHGSRAGLTDELVGQLSPELALVSCGASNRYGHPAPETVERLEAAGARILRTDRQGTVSLRLAPDAIAVEAEAP